MKELEGKLPNCFLRVHRSNIINLNKVSCMKQNPNLKIKMLNNKEVVISRSNQKIVKAKLSEIEKIS